ncbi:hypothetical protein PHISP_07808 [Aspergillus sp. HF37]|nr:hypothetical protein PHISP_07808 [Aspergillus sp. HF37]
MPSLSSAALALAFAAAVYLHARCITDPNPPQTRESHRIPDRISLLAGPSHNTARRIATAASLYHALLMLYYPPTGPNDTGDVLPQLCPRPANTAPSLFAWSPTTIVCILSMFLGGAIRLSAFGGLGRFFTFRLAAPDQLVTSGVYSFVQHPSYTGQVLLMVPNLWLVFGWNATAACFVDAGLLAWVRGWGVWASGVFGAAVLAGMGLRVRDEERMLREKFGDEWVAWNRKTKRFIPGVF